MLDYMRTAFSLLENKFHEDPGTTPVSSTTESQTLTSPWHLVGAQFICCLKG